jgi:hypothetical protein
METEYAIESGIKYPGESGVRKPMEKKPETTKPPKKTNQKSFDSKPKKKGIIIKSDGEKKVTPESPQVESSTKGFRGIYTIHTDIDIPDSIRFPFPKMEVGHAILEEFEDDEQKIKAVKSFIAAVERFKENEEFADWDFVLEVNEEEGKVTLFRSE